VGQILLVQAGSGGDARPVLERGLRAFRAVLGLDPHDSIQGPGFAVAKFPRLTGPGSKIARAGGGFTASAGTGVGLDGDGDLRRTIETLDGLFFCARGGADGITCATDLGGRMHVYHASCDGCLVLSTSALVLAAMIDAAFDPLGCQEMLGTGSVFEDRSIFLGVRKLGPATIAELRSGRIVSQERYFSVRSLFPAGMENPLSSAPALASALVAAAEATLAPFARPIVDLTGGFDSRGIVAAAIASGRPFECVVNGEDSDPDVRSAEKIAKKLGLRLARLRTGIDFGTASLAAIERAAALTDGEFDAVEYSGILEIHERLSRQGDATVNGSAGEICRGYWWDLLVPHTGARVPLDAARAARRFAPDDWADGILAAPAVPSLARHFEDVVRRTNADLEGLPNTVLADNVYLTLRMQRWAGRLASSTDRVWPCATPFMFRRPVEVALTAPVADRAHNRMAREMIAHLNPTLADLPMAGGFPASPIGIENFWRFGPLVAETATKALGRARRLLGFHRSAASPAAPSAAADLWAQDDVRTLLRPASMRTASLYEPAALARFLADSEAPGFTDRKKLGRILTLELVAQKLARAGAP